MSVRIWNSYSCNNSTSYRIVARFADAAKAKAIGAELTALLDGLEDRHNSGFQALARLYGFDWYDGGYGSEEDGPHVAVDGETLIVHHDYCLGIGPGVPAYLAEQGAQVDKENWADVHVAVLFKPTPDPRLEADLITLFAHPVDAEHRVVDGFKAPWVNEHTHGRIAWYRDANTVALFFPIDARDFVRLRTWFGERGIEHPIVRIEAYEDQELFRALAAARCTACEGALEYLDPRLHDIESPQLMCKPCGGLYDLDAVMRPA